MVTVSESIHCRLGNSEKVLIVESKGSLDQIVFKRNGNQLSLQWPSTFLQLTNGRI